MKKVVLGFFFVLVFISVCSAQGGLLNENQIGNTAPTIAATAGENLSQYDVVKVCYDGPATSAFKYGTSTYATTDLTAAGSTSNQSLMTAVSFSSSKKAIFWVESGVIYYQVIDFTAFNGAAAAGSRTSTTKNSDLESSLKACIMDSDKVAVAYDYNSSLYVTVGTVSGTTITFGSSRDTGITTSATLKHGIAISKLTTSKVLVGFAGYSDQLQLIAVTFSGTTYSSSGSIITPKGGSCTSADAYYVIDDKAVIGSTITGTGTLVAVVTASDNTLTYQSAGEANCVTIGTNPGVRLCMITSSNGALVTRNGSNNQIVSGFSVSGTTVTDGSGDIEMTDYGIGLFVDFICPLDGVTYNGCAVSWFYNIGTNPIYGQVDIFKFSGTTPTRNSGAGYRTGSRGNALSYMSSACVPVGADGFIAIWDDNNSSGADYIIRKANLTASTPVVATFGYSGNFLYGIAQASASAAGAINVWLALPYKTVAGLSLSTGRQYFVNDSTSALSTTVSANKYVGFALSDSKLIFDAMPYNSVASGTNPVSLQRY